MHSEQHGDAVRRYLEIHGKRSRRLGALERLEASPRRAVIAPATDERIEREIATLKQRLGLVR